MSKEEPPRDLLANMYFVRVKELEKELQDQMTKDFQSNITIEKLKADIQIKDGNLFNLERKFQDLQTKLKSAEVKLSLSELKIQTLDQSRQQNFSKIEDLENQVQLLELREKLSDSKCQGLEKTQENLQLKVEVSQLKFDKSQEEVRTLELKVEEVKSEKEIFMKQVQRRAYKVLEDNFNCTICTEIFIEPVVLDCSHTFCSRCILQWTGNCPLCRNVNFRPLIKHQGMEDCINEIYVLLAPEIKAQRVEILTDVGANVNIADAPPNPNIFGHSEDENDRDGNNDPGLAQQPRRGEEQPRGRRQRRRNNLP